MSFNLISKLSKEDRVKIEEYIRLYGVSDHFIGLDSWLQYWGKEKIKLYKLLGGSFFYRCPYEYVKEKEELKEQFFNFPELDNFINAFNSVLYKYREADIFLDKITTNSSLCENEIKESLKIKIPEQKSTLQIQKGAKPVKACSRLLNYFMPIMNEKQKEEITDLFEKFRLSHSMILNDKIIKGNLVISIHPLDFLTMSDNGSNWSSCMSWKNKGCYHVGTIEMMNSNNVLCCYLENKEPYYFNPNEKTEEYAWSNKRWRQLFILNKDIITNGKPYPYQNEEMTNFVLNKLRELAEKNLGWTYDYGIERYSDMKYIRSLYTMDRAKEYLRYTPTKHNIIFDTKGMYNDVLNDKNTIYNCVRNKVKKNKIISYSGRSNCLCCNNSIINNDVDYVEGYNDRFDNCGASVCEECQFTYFHCDLCNCTNTSYKFIKIKINDKEYRVCEKCVKDDFRVCPDCGKTFYTFNRSIDVENSVWNTPSYIKVPEKIYRELKATNLTPFFNMDSGPSYALSVEYEMYPIFRCKKCNEKDNKMIAKTKIEQRFGGGIERKHKVYLTKDIVKNYKEWEPYFFNNLKSVELADGACI